MLKFNNRLGVVQTLIKVSLFLDKISLISSKISMVFLWILTALVFGLSIALNFSYVNSKLDDFSLYCFALMALLSFSYALKEDKHVRVDLLYAHYSEKSKVVCALITNLFFILPFSLILVQYGLSFTLQSYTIMETSPNGRIPYYFIFKGFLVIGFILLALQSVSETLKAIIKLKENRFKA